MCDRRPVVGEGHLGAAVVGQGELPGEAVPDRALSWLSGGPADDLVLGEGDDAVFDPVVAVLLAVHGHDEGVADGGERLRGLGVAQSAGGVEFGVAAGVAEHGEDPFGRCVQHLGDGGVDRALHGDRVGVEPGPGDPSVAGGEDDRAAQQDRRPGRGGASILPLRPQFVAVLGVTQDFDVEVGQPGQDLRPVRRDLAGTDEPFGRSQRSFGDVVLGETAGDPFRDVGVDRVAQ